MDNLKVPNSINTDLILNTPNRNDILKDGPPTCDESNILGRGSYGTVFKATFRGKQVAVKIVKNSKSENWENVLNEANIIGWQHRNIVQILKIESTPDYGIVIMERFPGQCLQIILDSVELSMWHISNISLDIVSALIYSHKANIMHLDVKPQNVLVSFNYQQKSHQRNGKLPKFCRFVCKLCDFGSSMRIDDQKSIETKRNNKGTIRYMAPEALSGDTLDASADVFSLGITMWQMKHRLMPYHWIKSNEIVAYQVVKNNLRPDSEPFLLNNRMTITESLSDNHRNCLCKYYSTETSVHFIKGIRNILNQSVTMMATSDHGRRTICGRKCKEFTIERFPRNRLLFSTSSQKTSLKEYKFNRNLEFLKHFSKAKRNICFRKADDGVEMRKVRCAKLYEALYTACWHRDRDRRPSDNDIFKKLIHLSRLCKNC